MTNRKNGRNMDDSLATGNLAKPKGAHYKATLAALALLDGAAAALIFRKQLTTSRDVTPSTWLCGDAEVTTLS